MIQLESSNCCPFLSTAGYQLNQQADPNSSAVRTVVTEGMHIQSQDQPVQVVKWPTCCSCTGSLWGQTLQWHRMTARQTPGFHHAALTFPRLCLLIQRVFTLLRPYMKVRIGILHGAEGVIGFGLVTPTQLRATAAMPGQGAYEITTLHALSVMPQTWRLLLFHSTLLACAFHAAVCSPIFPPFF